MPPILTLIAAIGNAFQLYYVSSKILILKLSAWTEFRAYEDHTVDKFFITFCTIAAAISTLIQMLDFRLFMVAVLSL